jgi:DNA polymerase, archaea type
MRYAENRMKLEPQTKHQTKAWVFGWDTTPGIVSLWTGTGGEVLVWRRENGILTLEQDQYRPWIFAEHLKHLEHLGNALQHDSGDGEFAVRKLRGKGVYQYLITARDSRMLRGAILEGAKQAGLIANNISDLEGYYSVGAAEQYLMQTGRTFFQNLEFSDLKRLQFDLETTSLDPAFGRIIMIAVRDSSGFETLLEAPNPDDEAQVIRELVKIIQDRDPDVLENHNLIGFDLPYLEHRARELSVRLELGRAPAPTLLRRENVNDRFSVNGRELIDTLDAVWRHDFVARELPSHRLKDVAKHYKLAAPDREYITGSEIALEYTRNPERVRRYALEDVREVDRLSQRLMPASFALTKLAPRRFERVASAGTATGILEPMLVRAYLHEAYALPKSSRVYLEKPHEGGAVALYASGVAKNVVKADIASLYPSIMRAFKIGPECDELGAMLEIVDSLTTQRLEFKQLAKNAARETPAFAHADAMQAAMKLIINSAYGYLGAGKMALFADRPAADAITLHGRQILKDVTTQLRNAGMTLLEADTDGVFFALPETWNETQARDLVTKISDALPNGIKLEFDNLYRTMLSHEIKNYALLTFEGNMILRGAGFRSSRFEPFGAKFLESSVRCILENDVIGARNAYLTVIENLQARVYTASDVATRTKLSKSADNYAASRSKLKEAAYEAMLEAGKTWRKGERIRFYRVQNGKSKLLPIDEESTNPLELAKDYDVPYYVALFERTYVKRLEKAFTPEVFPQVFRSSVQSSLFDPPIEGLSVNWVVEEEKP